jgi:hypothetical protein
MSTCIISMKCGGMSHYVSEEEVTASFSLSEFYKTIIEIIPFHVRFEVFTAVTMKNFVFWMLCRVPLVRTDVSEEPSISSQRASVASCS